MNHGTMSGTFTLCYSTILGADRTVDFDWARVSTYNRQSIRAGVRGSESHFLMDVEKNLRNKLVVLVDDSIASGGSMRLLTRLLVPKLGSRGQIHCVGLIRANTSIVPSSARSARSLALKTEQQGARVPSSTTKLFGHPPHPPLCALQLFDLEARHKISLGQDPFSLIAGYGNDALSKFRLLPEVVTIFVHLRDAVWAEDTFSGAIDWRLFAGKNTKARTFLCDQSRKKVQEAEARVTACINNRREDLCDPRRLKRESKL